MAILDLNNFFMQVLGYIPPKFEATDLPARKEISNQGAPLYAKDRLGREYYMPVKLGGVQLPLPLISLDTAEQNWVIRKMLNRNGTSKGLLGTGDYRIYIRGFCLGNNGQMPEEDLAVLSALEKRRERMDIESALTAIFLPAPQQAIRVSPIRISEIRRGMKGVLEYQFELLSDQPFTLEVTNK